ncbi:MAG: M28 family peptidase [Chthoniobacteraceae bacterium]
MSRQAPPPDLWKQISGDRAWRTAKQLVEIGPRPTGSMELGRARGVLASALASAGWEVEQQSFTATTPRGDIGGTNLIARFAADGARPVPRAPRSVLIGAHYDTRYFTAIQFVGANDGASGPALLVEIARVLALDPQFAEKIELVLFDAGEPRSQFSAADGLAGSRHHAKAGTPRRAVVLHSVGDSTNTLTLPLETALDLLADVRAATAALKTGLQLKTAPARLWGDHISLGAGALLLGNHDYEQRYTADDTLERMAPATLGAVGELAVWLARRWAAQ